MVEKVAIQSSGLRISFSSLTLKEMFGDESHRLSGKGGDQSSGLRISFSSLTLKEMFGDESYFIMAEKVGPNRPAFAFLFPR